MELPHLTIGARTARLPIVQGGMAVRISLAPLAAAVAREGGIGVIAGSGLTPEELAQEVRRARAETDGVLAVNVMVAVRQFKELVQTAIAEGIDIVIAGAGFSRDVFGWCHDAGVEIVPIVGSARVAKLAERFGASAVIVEGYEAGGHLGTDRYILDLLPEILEAVDVPVIGAGGVVTGADIKRVLDAGAAGVQMGSRFAATVESSASEAFKQMYVNATASDIVIVKSPVGLPGRAIRNPFVQNLERGEVPRIERCVACLKECHRDYCIMDKLVKAQQGDVVNGLVFAGSSAARVHDVPTVKELIARLIDEWREATLAESPAE
ncbi:nitronate monooxygenase [Coriobacteriia bacterium Es71-Z0120]|uniref:NAD(P)H-dependent flavin oxidoreductase n=1 Tax=Parvivirga hydrogeniphila TaxID=2939460 RepID=UPI0022609A56|nr:nitronate monooxygenase [Parvivirga hydrogeniphila]MCL4079565.1 nitronate monooxygenase [Parvivirga hydrogeniphila]